MSEEHECKGWGISSRYCSDHTPDGALVVERCDECHWYGEKDPRTKYDEDMAVVARKAGVLCRLDYPCLLLHGTRAHVDKCQHCGHDFRKDGIDVYFTPDDETFTALTYVWGPNLVLLPTTNVTAQPVYSSLGAGRPMR